MYETQCNKMADPGLAVGEERVATYKDGAESKKIPPKQLFYFSLTIFQWISA